MFVVMPTTPTGRRPTILGVSIFPGVAGLFMLYHPANVVFGRRVYFTDAPEVV